MRAKIKDVWNIDAEALNIEFFDGKTLVFSDKDKGEMIILWSLFPRPGGEKIFGSVVHEITHVTITVMKSRNITDEETHCYYSQFLADEILPNLKKLADMYKPKGVKKHGNSKKDRKEKGKSPAISAEERRGSYKVSQVRSNN